MPLSRKLSDVIYILQWIKLQIIFRDGRLPSSTLHGKSVLTPIPIYHLIAIHCPKWVIKANDTIRRGFLWKGGKDIKG
jgi:hypothetical protein